MAIYMQCEQSEPESIPVNYCGATYYVKESYKGCVISLGEHNRYDDSDFYAVVWSDTAESPIEIEYASTRGWSYVNNAIVDLTPDRAAKLEQYKQDELYRKRIVAAKIARLTPKSGMLAKSLTTKGKAKGAIGKISKIIEDRYSYEKNYVVCINGVWVSVERILISLDNGDTWEKPCQFSRYFGWSLPL